MRVLIIHHLEGMWEESYRRYNTSYERLLEQFTDHVIDEPYDKIILTRFEGVGFDEYHRIYGFDRFVDEVHEYGYGWDREGAEEWYPDGEGVDWCEGGDHSEVVYLEDWMRALKGHEVFISGAFDGECIEDLEYALRGVGVAYQRLENLIVG